MQALEKDQKSGRGTTVRRAGALVWDDPEADWVCASCGAPISGPRHAFSMGAGGPSQVFPNPLGQLRVIVTVRQATHWLARGGAFAEYTWFDGYTWQIILCGGCGAHLGWRYQAELGLQPSFFFGLLAAALKEG